MTKDEALKLALEALKKGDYALVNAICEELKQAQPEQEPVACIEYIPCCTDKTCPKCKATTPPQRTWVGLTDEDRKQISKEANYHWEMTAGEYAERIGELTEAKLKEKNT